MCIPSEIAAYDKEYGDPASGVEKKDGK
jgi:hypothetical protein